MNELDEGLAQLFVDDEEPGAQSEAFVAAVHRRVARRRVAAKVLAVGAVVALAAAAVALAAFVPEVVAYPGQEIARLLSSPAGAIGCLLGSVGAVWWTRYEDA